MKIQTNKYQTVPANVRLNKYRTVKNNVPKNIGILECSDDGMLEHGNGYLYNKLINSINVPTYN